MVWCGDWDVRDLQADTDERHVQVVTKYNAKRGSLDYCRGDPRGDAAHHSLLAEIIYANS